MADLPCTSGADYHNLSHNNQYNYLLYITGFVLSHADREANMEGFSAWVKEHGVVTDAVSIDKFDEGGFGLKANKDIKVTETVKVLFGGHTQ